MLLLPDCDGHITRDDAGLHGRDENSEGANGPGTERRATKWYGYLCKAVLCTIPNVFIYTY